MAVRRQMYLDSVYCLIINIYRHVLFQVDLLTVGTDGFLTNLVTVLLKLSDPFMDAEYSKVIVMNLLWEYWGDRFSNKNYLLISD